MIKMMPLVLTSTLIVVAGLSLAQVQQQVRTVALKVVGLHCEGCVEPVEKGLRQLKGVHSVTLDFKTAVAEIRYDEAQIPLSQIVLALPKIPHAMGPRSKMKYEGRLLLKLAKGDPKKIAQAIGKVQGIAKVQSERDTLFVAFKPDASVRYAQIEQAVNQVGGTLAPVKPAEKPHQSHSP